MNNEKKTIFRIIIFSSLAISAIIGITFYLYFNTENEIPVCGTKSPEFVYGTESTPPEKLEGKKIFNSNCAACHKLDSKSNGPALRAIDSTKYWKMFARKNSEIDTTKIKQFGIDFHKSNYPNLTEEDLENIYLYTR